MVRGALCKRLISRLLAAAETGGSGSSRSPAQRVVGTRRSARAPLAEESANHSADA
ncbi:Uncharacterized protein DAT39_006979, partial [Clarias magur]